MSTEIKNINTQKGDLQFTQFSGGIQLTQGFGGTTMGYNNNDEPGFIQLSPIEVYKTIQILAQWLKEMTAKKAEELRAEIIKDQRLRKTIIKDAVDCQHFIEDLKVIEIPVRLLSSNKKGRGHGHN